MLERTGTDHGGGNSELAWRPALEVRSPIGDLAASVSSWGRGTGSAARRGETVAGSHAPLAGRATVYSILQVTMRALLISFSLAGCGLAASDFETRVLPVLEVNCASCHSPKVKTSGFSVATIEAVIAGGNKHGRAVVPGHPEQSALVKVLKGDIAPRMPFGKTLEDADMAVIEGWIRGLNPSQAAGAGQPSLWPYQKPVRRDPPKPGHPIDAFLTEKLSAKKLTFAPEASKRPLARRVYFDLLGMPPPPAELSAFLDDSSSGAYAKLLDRLLADPRYGERWGRHWLDLVRYGETSGLEGDGPIGNAWRYRDWVIDAFNADMPYDKFVIKQLGGADEHSQTRNNYAPDVQGHVPVAFLRLAPWDRSNLVADEVRQNYLNEVATVTSSVFLGLTMGCARCHDHKYDPIPTKDFYRFQAFFSAIRAEDVEVPYRDKAFAEWAQKKVEEYQTRVKSGPEKKELDELEKSLLLRLVERRSAELAEWKATREELRLEFRRKPRTLFTEAEIARFDQLLEDAARTQDLEEKTALDRYEAGLLNRLKPDAARYQALTVDDVRAEIGKTASKVYSADVREKHREFSGKVDVFRRRAARLQPRTLSITNVPGPPNGPGLPLTHVLISGDYRQPGEAVEAGFPSAITGNMKPAAFETDRYRQFPTRGRRITLAKWIASKENPLTARVMVNRIWQHHFGRGIVETASDFGKNDSRPTHPELLDWLANRFVDEDWSVKAMHRLMLTSAAYRQSAENPAAADNTADPENTLLWRFSRRRLEAEEIRDSVFAVSGRLNLKQGGPSVYPPLPADLADFARYGRTGGEMWEANEHEEDNRRRSVYTFQRRSLPQPMMLAFDAPVFSESCERRSNTTTALQALSMLNGDLLHEESVHLADRVATEAGADSRARVARAFEIVLGRAPGADELDKFAGHAGSLAAVCRVLLSSNEFLYID